MAACRFVCPWVSSQRNWARMVAFLVVVQSGGSLAAMLFDCLESAWPVLVKTFVESGKSLRSGRG